MTSLKLELPSRVSYSSTSASLTMNIIFRRGVSTVLSTFSPLFSTSPEREIDTNVDAARLEACAT
jgi:hypothetical protein